ncbi:MAG: DinB family protein [Nitrospinaceae bacterium]|nr:DinB family protein [Nitrospinaceae bacterium]
MEATELIEKLLDMNEGAIEMALDGLPDEQFNEAPTTETNHIGWILWHKTRVEDAVIAHVSGGSQVWTDGGWGEKFGVDPAPNNIGLGHSLETVHAIKPSKAGLSEYAKAVREKTKAALKTISPEELDKEIPDFIPNQTIRAGVLLGRALLIDNVMHSGQVMYLRGYYTGFGWLPF